MSAFYLVRNKMYLNYAGLLPEITGVGEFFGGILWQKLCVSSPVQLFWCQVSSVAAGLVALWPGWWCCRQVSQILLPSWKSCRRVGLPPSCPVITHFCHQPWSCIEELVSFFSFELALPTPWWSLKIPRSKIHFQTSKHSKSIILHPKLENMWTELDTRKIVRLNIEISIFHRTQIMQWVNRK